ncbi:uncharacterized protein [Periplaneta americana]|uniref:uncharacterized protein isoform X5 n=1 Tax=Periplaneta americana TaxID=6978 RepID=UPI0037E75355
MTTAYLIVVEDVRSLHTAILYSTLHSVLCVLYVEVRKSLSSVVHFHLSTLYRAVMDMIKKEPEVDPLAIWSSDNIDTDEKKPLLQEGNFLDRNMIMLKEDCVDCNYDLKSEFVFKETAVPIDFSTVKNEAKEGNSLDSSVVEIKTECVDQKYDLVSDIKVEETAVPTNFVATKCRAEKSLLENAGGEWICVSEQEEQEKERRQRLRQR